jgi:hypothetical protein
METKWRVSIQFAGVRWPISKECIHYNTSFKDEAALDVYNPASLI